MNQKKPNVIVFFTDQQRFDTTGVHGNPCGLTPNFDRVAMEGTHANLAFTPQPVCGPARGALQTGKYATCVGTYRNAVVLPPEHKTMAHYFNEAGYYTGYIGKWHLGSTRHAVPRKERGEYQYWLGSGALEATSQAYNTLVYDNDDKPVQLPGYRVDALTDAAIRFIDNNKEQPFFLFLSFLEPHFQNSNDSYPAPDIYNNLPAGYMPPDLAALGGTAHQHLPGYYGMVKRLDEAFGRVLDTLKSLHLSEDTIILFTTDHGNHFKTRNEEYKRSCHESSIRIPMAFTGGPFTSGGRLREMVSLIDIAPTLLDACNIPVPDDMQGRSIIPLIYKNCEDWPQEVLIQMSEVQVGRAIRTKRWKYSVEALDKHPIWDSCSDTYTETFLYDLEHDPYELRNLIHSETHRPVCLVLAEKLKKKMVEAGEKEPVILEAEKWKEGQLCLFEGEEYL